MRKGVVITQAAHITYFEARYSEPIFWALVNDAAEMYVSGMPVRHEFRDGLEAYDCSQHAHQFARTAKQLAFYEKQRTPEARKKVSDRMGGRQSKKFPCQICDQKFKNEYDLNAHSLFAHGKYREVCGTDLEAQINYTAEKLRVQFKNQGGHSIEVGVAFHWFLDNDIQIRKIAGYRNDGTPFWTGTYGNNCTDEPNHAWEQDCIEKYGEKWWELYRTLNSSIADKLRWFEEDLDGSRLTDSQIRSAEIALGITTLGKNTLESWVSRNMYIDSFIFKEVRFIVEECYGWEEDFQINENWTKQIMFRILRRYHSKEHEARLLFSQTRTKAKHSLANACPICKWLVEEVKNRGILDQDEEVRGLVKELSHGGKSNGNPFCLTCGIEFNPYKLHCSGHKEEDLIKNWGVRSCTKTKSGHCSACGKIRGISTDFCSLDCWEKWYTTRINEEWWSKGAHVKYLPNYNSNIEKRAKNVNYLRSHKRNLDLEHHRTEVE